MSSIVDPNPPISEYNNEPDHNPVNDDENIVPMRILKMPKSAPTRENTAKGPKHIPQTFHKLTPLKHTIYYVYVYVL